MTFALVFKGMAYMEQYTHYGDLAPYTIDYRDALQSQYARLYAPLRKAGRVETFLLTHDRPNDPAFKRRLIRDYAAADYLFYDEAFYHQHASLCTAEKRLLTFMLTSIDRVENYERRTGVAFDYIIITRFDLYFKQTFGPERFRPDKVLFGWSGEHGQSDDNLIVIPKALRDAFYKTVANMRDHSMSTHAINSQLRLHTGNEAVCEYVHLLKYRHPETNAPLEPDIYVFLRVISEDRRVSDKENVMCSTFIETMTSARTTRIFYDGTDLAKYGTHPGVVGFTTNTSFIKAAGVCNYRSFLDTHKEVVAGRPISLQVFADDGETIYAQAKAIAALGHNVYAKVPVQTSSGVSNADIIARLLQEGVKVNITAVFTPDQVNAIVPALRSSTTPAVVSVFAGRISDTGVDPLAAVKYAVDAVRDLLHAEVLWAGCKDNASIVRAEEIGCHIVTVPDTILTRMGRIGGSIDAMALDTVRMFYEDGVNAGITID